MAFELTGTILEITPTQQVTASFSKREFVVSAPDKVGDNEYPNFPKFQVTQNKCDLLDAFTPGQEVKVSFNVKGNKWQKDGKDSYFTSLQAWKIEGTNPAPAYTPEQFTPGTDDLPF
mgnify:CR=1 FL=1